LAGDGFPKIAESWETADDRGLTAAVALGDLIEAGSVTLCRRLQALPSRARARILT
jgi:hypothetical protein